MHFGKHNGFDRGRLHLAPASLKRRCVVLSLTVASIFLNLFVMPPAVTNVCCSAREAICLCCLEVVVHALPDRIELIQSFDCLSQYFTIIKSH